MNKVSTVIYIQAYDWMGTVQLVFLINHIFRKWNSSLSLRFTAHLRDKWASITHPHTHTVYMLCLITEHGKSPLGLNFVSHQRRAFTSFFPSENDSVQAGDTSVWRVHCDHSVYSRDKFTVIWVALTNQIKKG